MKTVIFEENKDIIRVDQLTDSHLIGISFSDGIRGFVMKVDTKNYVVATVGTNNYIRKTSGKSIKELLNSLCNPTAFTFSTAEELTGWLAGAKF